MCAQYIYIYIYIYEYNEYIIFNIILNIDILDYIKQYRYELCKFRYFYIYPCTQVMDKLFEIFFKYTHIYPCI